MSRLVLVASIKEGVGERVRELLAQGPPFELERTAVEWHDVYVTEREVIFVFESSTEQALRIPGDDPAVWKAAAAWQQCLAGRPRKATTAFSWTRTDGAENVFFEPTPGPGDSDGGDIFPP